MKLSRETREYVQEYAEKIDEIPAEATVIADHRSYQVGRVYYTIGLDIYISDYTGSDVSEWAIIRYALTDAEDAVPSNESIIAMLNAPTPKRQAPMMVLCNCGHYTETPMSTSWGTSCPDCYDDMSD